MDVAYIEREKQRQRDLEASAQALAEYQRMLRVRELRTILDRLLQRRFEYEMNSRARKPARFWFFGSMPIYRRSERAQGKLDGYTAAIRIVEDMLVTLLDKADDASD